MEIVTLGRLQVGTEVAWRLQAVELELVRSCFRIQRTDGAWRIQAWTEGAQRLQARTEGSQCIVSLGGQNLVTGWAVAITGWAFAHPVNMLAEALL